MEKDRFTQEQFIEYLDRLLAGEEIHIGEDVDDEMRSALEFARTMLASRDEPSPAFRASLKERLLRRLAREEAVAPDSVAGKGFGEWARDLFSHSAMWRAAASVAVVMLMVIAGVFWYTGRLPQAASPAPSMPQPESVYSVDLPASVIPANVTFMVETELSAQPGQAVVYKIEVPEVSVEAVEKLGKRLGFDGDASFIDDGSKIAMFEETGIEARELIVWTASGAIEYGFTGLDRLYPLEPPELPSEQAAKQIAYDFLGRTDLLPPGYETFSRFKGEAEVIAGGSYSVSKIAEDEPVQKGPAYWLVSIPYSIDGLWTTGPGSIIEVNISDGGEVVRLTWSWREVFPDFTGDILSEREAFYSLVKGEGSLELPLDCKQVIVTDARLVYWMNSSSEKQDYALPVYRFEGKCLDTRGETLEDFIAWTKALSGSY